MILLAVGFAALRQNPLRHLVTVAGVAIGVASVVSTFAASRAAVAFLAGDVEAIAGAARLEIRRPGGVLVADLDALRPFCDELVIAPVVEDLVLCTELGDLVRLLGIDPFVDDAVRALELDLGGGLAAGPNDRTAERDAPDAGPDAFSLFVEGAGVALSNGLADELGLAVGGELELVVRSRPVTVAVAAVFEPERFASVWDRVVVCDFALAQELLGLAGAGADGGARVDRVELAPRAGVELDAQALGPLAARLQSALPSGYTVGSANDRKRQGESMTRALEFNLTALSGVSVLVGIVLVATTLATTVVQRRRTIALLLSLGASSRQLAAAILGEAAALGTVGGLLGVLLGWLGARVALRGVRTSVATIVQGTATGDVPFDPRWAAGGLALGLGASLVAAILPLREALRTPPIQGLAAVPDSHSERAYGRRALAFAGLVAVAFGFTRLPPLEDRPIWALAAALCLLSTLLVAAAPLVDLGCALRLAPRGTSLARTTTLRIAQAALAASRGRAAWAAGAVGVALGLAVAMTTMVGSFRRTVVAWTEQTLGSDLFVRPVSSSSGMLANRIDPAVVERANALFGAANVDPYHKTSAQLDGKEYTLAGAELRVVAREGGVPFLDGRDSRAVFAEALERGGAIVNEPFARRFGRGRGDRIAVTSPGGSVEREIVGVYRDYSGHTGRLVLDRADFLALYPDQGPESIAVYLPDSEGAGGEPDVEAARRALVAALGAEFAVEILSNREIRQEVLDVFERTFAVTVALQLIASVVAGIAVVTVLSALVSERRQELAVLRVLGGSPAQVAGVVVLEALLLAFAGTLGGLAVGLAVGWVLVAVVNVQSFGWTLAFEPPWGAVLGIAAATLPACLIAALPPVLAALRTHPREALHELG